MPIKDGETDLLKGQAISELLRRWEIEFLTRAPRAIAPETVAVAREQESERGNRFSGLHSYISELVNTDDVFKSLASFIMKAPGVEGSETKSKQIN